VATIANRPYRSLEGSARARLDHDAEEWQVAMHLRPMKLDGEGRAIKATT
jgi:hypothetical protein